MEKPDQSVATEQGMTYKQLEELNRHGLTIRLGGTVNEDMVKSFRTQQRDLYKGQKEVPKEAAILLTTKGGSIQSGLELQNLINMFRLGGVERLWIVSMVCLASSGLIVLAGQPDKRLRVVFPGTQTYHHRSSISREGTPNAPAMVHEYEIAEYSSTLKKYKKIEVLLSKLFAEVTGCSEKRLKELEEHPKHLSTKEAIKYGFYGSVVK